MSTSSDKGGGFGVPETPQAQAKPGLESQMQPASEATKVETPDGLVEYAGSGKLKDKKVLITGGDSGIGRSVAILMAREGADITIAYLPEEQTDAEETKKAVEAEKRSCLLVPGDLSKRDTCRATVEKHIEKYKKLNVLINNASKQYICKDFADIDLDKVQETFQCNVLQMMAVTKFALPHMSNGDSIINSSSVTAFRGSSGMVDYSSTKGAIVSFTRALAAQLAPKGIRVNCVAPGVIYTPIQADTREPDQMAGLGKSSRIGRPGQPVEVATSYVFLASPDSSLYCMFTPLDPSHCVVGYLLSADGQVMHCYPLGD
ncbi:oxidoreductase [Aspergillus campestris IBT 28561]|uniref:Oxidoreductase n=1 Tax=Aspergillus campestris (strain IBT 28561) TaxID=1392248 RepID=A0A2I1D993_ASPC2|nr:oxidoreductase [Aspergillus campestris IBT 28561]PKY06461.1 oxidoreductase [Aspergillus campestris IBT 28561]